MATVAEDARLIDGMTLLPLRCHRDGRGDLVAFDPSMNMPFDLRRAFVIKAEGPGVSRGGHANSCHELIVALAGSVRVACDDGERSASVDLCRHDQALWIRPGIVIHLSGFAEGTVLLVCASEAYADTRHFAAARPDLVRPDAPR